ncbi:MAG: hypothetical protein H8K07_01440 [Nitrospira sp.]|nr:hypothetical protein [Nitrospira sp.]
MSLMFGKLYNALKSAGVSEEAAEAAAAEVAGYENRLGKIETDVAVVKWMAGTNIALTLLSLGLLYQVLTRLH